MKLRIGSVILGVAIALAGCSTDRRNGNGADRTDQQGGGAPAYSGGGQGGGDATQGGAGAQGGGAVTGGSQTGIPQGNANQNNGAGSSTGAGAPASGTNPNANQQR